MSDKYLEYRKSMFEIWIREQIEAWINEFDAWDYYLLDEDCEFDSGDWDFIRNNLAVGNIEILERKNAK